MCGRYVLSSWADVIGPLGLELGQPDWFEARYNVAPTQVEPVILQREPRAPLDVAPMRWGLVPSWADDLRFGARCINARSETVHEKPSFRDAFLSRRAVVPATGFFEWLREGRERRPHYVHDSRGDRPLLFAGLWSSWRDRAGDRQVETFTILTRPSVGPLAEIHDRMPVCLEVDDARRWVDARKAVRDRAVAWLAAVQPVDLALHPVSRRVNRVGTEGAELIEEAG